MSVAVECVKDKQTQKHIVLTVGHLIRKEVKELCSNKISSVQRYRDAKSLQDFSWDTIVDEAAQHAPNLVHLLMECTKKYKKREAARINQKSIVGMCISLICKHQNRKMSVVQKMLGLILYAGHTAKQVSVSTN